MTGPPPRAPVGEVVLVALVVAPLPPVVLTTDVLRGAALLIACAVILASHGFSRRGDAITSHAHAAILAVVGAGVGAWVVGADAAADPEVWLPWVLGPALVAAWSTAPPESVRHALVLGLAGVAAVGIAQHLGAPLFGAEHAPFSGRRAIGTVGNPTIAGIASAAGLAGARGVDTDRLERVAIAVLAAAVIVSASRIAWLGAAVGVALAGRHGPWGTPRALAAGSVAGLAAALVPHATIVERIAHAPAAVAGRWDALEASMRWMPRRIAWLGDGPGAFGRAWPGIAARDGDLDPLLQHLHFDALEVAWAIGIPLAILGVAWTGRHIHRALPASDARRAGAAMLATLACAGLAQPVLFVHVTLAVAAAAWRIALPEPADAATTDATRLRRVVAIAAVVALMLCGPLAARRVASDAALQPALTAEASPWDHRYQDAVDRAVRLDPTNPRARLVRGLDPERLGGPRCDDLRRVVRIRPEPSLVALRRVLRCE